MSPKQLHPHLKKLNNFALNYTRNYTPPAPIIKGKIVVSFWAEIAVHILYHHFQY